MAVTAAVSPRSSPQSSKGRLEVRIVLELIERERVTQFVGVPTQSWDLLECPDFERRDTSSQLNVVVGGAPAPCPSSNCA